MKIIKDLRAQGLSKWAIAKELGVTWNTVYHWEKKTFKPTKEHLEKAIELYNRGKAKDESC